MALKPDWFDVTSVVKTWFDETSVPEGWFDVTNIPEGGTSPDITLALSGLSVVTTAVGILGVKNDKALTGAAVTTSQGTITPVITAGDVTVAIVGQSVTTAVGTIGLKNDKVLAGQSSTTSQGTLGVDTKLAIVGQSSTTQQGTIGVSIGSDVTIQLTGQQASEATAQASGNRLRDQQRQGNAADNSATGARVPQGEGRQQP